MLFLVLMLLTVFNNDSEPIVDGTLPPALSGPEDSPQVLDNLRLWFGIAFALVVLAYALPLAGIVAQSGLFGQDIQPFPVSSEAVMYLEFGLDYVGALIT